MSWRVISVTVAVAKLSLKGLVRDVSECIGQ